MRLLTALTSEVLQELVENEKCLDLADVEYVLHAHLERFISIRHDVCCRFIFCDGRLSRF